MLIKIREVRNDIGLWRRLEALFVVEMGSQK
jgi:hypothetical protein